MTTATNDQTATAPALRMPSLGADMTAGTVVAWHVAPGDRVEKGAVVAEVETEKGVFDVDIPFGGTVEAILVPKGTKVPVGTVLARFAGALPPPAAAPLPAPAAPPPAPAAPLAAPAAPSERSARRSSPAARRLAEERGLDLSTIDGTGPDHAVRLVDVEHALEGRPAAAAPAAPIVSGMRQAIAAAVSRSKREIPHYYLSTDIDLGPLLAWLAAENGRRPVVARILPAAVLLKAVAAALAKHRDLNGWWMDGGFRPSSGIHVGVAISLRGGGLVAPAIHDADTRTVDDLMAALLDLVERARTGGLRSSEMADASVTVTNLGDDGASAVFGVIHPPQVAIVGFGGIAERPWAANGMLGVRPVVTATLSGDHRATDGHYGSRFLAEVDRVLRHPESL